MPSNPRLRLKSYFKWPDMMSAKQPWTGSTVLKGWTKAIQRNKLWFKETNTVIYDPQQITLDEMKSALQKAGTYKGIIAPEE